MITFLPGSEVCTSCLSSQRFRLLPVTTIFWFSLDKINKMVLFFPPGALSSAPATCEQAFLPEHTLPLTCFLHFCCLCSVLNTNSFLQMERIVLSLLESNYYKYLPNCMAYPLRINKHFTMFIKKTSQRLH